MKTQDLIEKLKKQQDISRDDINELLKTVGKPGEKRDEKVKAVKELDRQNTQGHDVSLTLEDYGNF